MGDGCCPGKPKDQPPTEELVRAYNMSEDRQVTRKSPYSCGEESSKVKADSLTLLQHSTLSSQKTVRRGGPSQPHRPSPSSISSQKIIKRGGPSFSSYSTSPSLLFSTHPDPYQQSLSLLSPSQPKKKNNKIQALSPPKYYALNRLILLLPIIQQLMKRKISF